MEKVCSSCKETKKLEDFNRHSYKKDGRQSECRECVHAYLSTYYVKNRNRIIQQNSLNNIIKKPLVKSYLVEKFGGACQGCGGKFPDAELHFHHRDPSTKEFGIGDMKTTSLERLEREAAKCDMLCQDCHTEAHIERGDLGLRKAA